MSVGRYALFDWDNTLRGGFTITSWVEYLNANHVVSSDRYSDLLLQFDLHKKAKITYEELSNFTTQIYAKAIKGISVAELDHLALEFCLQDKAVFPFTSRLLSTLHSAGIETIVVSGSPQVVLFQYAKMFEITETYGMEIESKFGLYTGVPKQDYGSQKSSIVNTILRKRAHSPLFAFGDSLADMPLLEAAQYGYLISDKGKNALYDGSKIETADLVKQISEISRKIF